MKPRMRCYQGHPIVMESPSEKILIIRCEEEGCLWVQQRIGGISGTRQIELLIEQSIAADRALITQELGRNIKCSR